MRPFGCRTRTKYTKEQVTILERVFGETHYPNIDTLDTLSLKLDVPVDKLNIWFQNRRSKFKRQSKGSHVGWMRTQIFKDNCKHGARHVLSPPSQSNFFKPSTNPDNLLKESSPLSYSYRLPRDGCFSPAPSGGGSPEIVQQTIVSRRSSNTPDSHFTFVLETETEKSHAMDFSRFLNIEDNSFKDYLYSLLPSPRPLSRNMRTSANDSTRGFDRDYPNQRITDFRLSDQNRAIIETDTRDSQKGYINPGSVSSHLPSLTSSVYRGSVRGPPLHFAPGPRSPFIPELTPWSLESSLSGPMWFDCPQTACSLLSYNQPIFKASKPAMRNIENVP